MDNKYVDFALLKAGELIGIDSPTGFTDKAAEYVKKEFEKLGFNSRYTTKGGVLVDLGGEDDENGISNGFTSEGQWKAVYVSSWWASCSWVGG